MFLASIVIMVVRISLLEYTHGKRILIFILPSKKLDVIHFSKNPKSHALSHIYLGILFRCTENQEIKFLGKILGMHQEFLYFVFFHSFCHF